MPYSKRYPAEYYTDLHKVYYLSFDGVPFYIGVTKMPLIKRLSDSTKDARIKYSPVHSFIKEKMYKENKVIEINIIESIPYKIHALFIEEYWIHQFKQWGFYLLNCWKVNPPKRYDKRAIRKYQS